MASPPQVSPDGAYWWDGQAWQPTVPDGRATVAQPVPDAARPSWLPEGVELPGPTSSQLDAPFTPAVIGTPFPAFTPAWAGETEAPSTSLSITKTILVWAGLVLGGAILAIGLIGLATSLGEPPSVERTASLSGASLLIIFGGAIFAPCLAVVLGFAPVVGATLHSLGILGCVVVLGMVINTAVAVTTPLGAGRFVMPWGTVAVVVFRAWRGRWLGAGIIVITWAVGAAIILTLGRS